MRSGQYSVGARSKREGLSLTETEATKGRVAHLREFWTDLQMSLSRPSHSGQQLSPSLLLSPLRGDTAITSGHVMSPPLRSSL